MFETFLFEVKSVVGHKLECNLEVYGIQTPYDELRL